MPNHKYLYKVFLTGENKEEYALNDVNIPIYSYPNRNVEKLENLTEKSVKENLFNDIKATAPIILNEDNLVNESNSELINSKEKVIEEVNKDSKCNEEVKEERIDLSKELISTENKDENINEISELQNDFHTLYSVDEPIIIKKDKLLKYNNNLILTYYCKENTDIDENNLTIYRIDENKKN